MYDTDNPVPEDNLYIPEESIQEICIALELREDDTLPVFDPMVTRLENAVQQTMKFLQPDDKRVDTPMTDETQMIAKDVSFIEPLVGADLSEIHIDPLDIPMDKPEDYDIGYALTPPSIIDNLQPTHSEVILFVDNREKRNQQDGQYFFENLEKNGISVQILPLKVGDFLWVLRVYNSSDISDQHKAKKRPTNYTDYVLDFIVERKTSDDLAASIIDGRYEE